MPSTSVGPHPKVRLVLTASSIATGYDESRRSHHLLPFSESVDFGPYSAAFGT